MRDIEKFIMEAPAGQIWKQVHKRIVGTQADYKAVRWWVMAWLKQRDRRETYYKDLIRILKR